jgi:predicted aminopeptidase
MEKRYAAIRLQWRGDSRYDRFFAKPMNNARLNTVATYYDLLPAFERLLKQCDGDLEQFFAVLKATKSLSKKDRRARLIDGTLR